MKELSNIDINLVAGGCAEHCWGDFSAGSLAGNMVGGAVAGSRGGLAGAAVGAAGGGIAYLLSVMWKRN